MTEAKTIAARLVAKKIPNQLSHGETVYSFSEEELVQLIDAVQQEVTPTTRSDRHMASFICKEIDDTLWRKVKSKAASEGVSLKDLFLNLVTNYAEEPTTKKKRAAANG